MWRKVYFFILVLIVGYVFAIKGLLPRSLADAVESFVLITIIIGLYNYAFTKQKVEKYWKAIFIFDLAYLVVYLIRRLVFANLPTFGLLQSVQPISSDPNYLLGFMVFLPAGYALYKSITNKTL